MDEKTATTSRNKRPFNLPLALTIGGMITLGITTTTLGFLLWPEPGRFEDTSTEGWPDGGPDWATSRRARSQSASGAAPQAMPGAAPGATSGAVPQATPGAGEPRVDADSAPDAGPGELPGKP